MFLTNYKEIETFEDLNIEKLKNFSYLFFMEWNSDNKELYKDIKIFLQFHFGTNSSILAISTSDITVIQDVKSNMKNLGFKLDISKKDCVILHYIPIWCCDIKPSSKSYEVLIKENNKLEQYTQEIIQKINSAKFQTEIIKPIKNLISPKELIKTIKSTIIGV